MSIEKMLAEHPSGADLSAALAKTVSHAQTCAIICTSCADACLAERHKMAACIRACLDCADVCAAVARIAARRTESNEALIQEALQLCITACDICAEECEKHDHAHCQRCAKICRTTAHDARAAVEAGV